MNSTIRWLVGLSQRNPALAIIAILLIGVLFVGGASRILYSDGKDRDRRYEERIRVLSSENTALREETVVLNNKLITQTIAFHLQKQRDDSIAISKLSQLNAELEEKVRQQREINQLQARNIEKRSKVIRLNDSIKKQNDKKIKALQNEIKK